MKAELFQVDAFTNRHFAGNPAAVVPLTAWPDDSVLLAIAEENNLAETAFFVPIEGGFELRWFTPRVEIDLCGHATLASAYVLFNYLGYKGRQISFTTRKSGVLKVERQGQRLSMDFPARPHNEVQRNLDLEQALGASPVRLLHGRDFVALFDSEDEVRALKPHMARLEQVAKHGVMVSSPGKDCDFVVRAFFPALGIPEDPVTGSAYTVLAPYWAKSMGKTVFTARQLSKRGGEIDVELIGDRIAISGSAVLYLRGEIYWDSSV
ncbi:MAG: PhzF family phenazine biosynthesis protein [Oligoflexia bacterium]|nr:PhzF family phenazine biosynthesis protein [Oligoflexia bacterium]